jgi:hypothetical protein
MLSGRFDGDMSDQGKRGFIFSSAVGFGDLNLLALPFVASVAGTGVRRVLQGIAGNLLVGVDSDLFVAGFVRRVKSSPPRAVMVS